MMLAPVIDLALVFDVPLRLAPIAHGGELCSRRRSTIPEIEQYRLARPGAEARQGRDDAIRIADILAVRDTVGVGVDEGPGTAIALSELEFVTDGIGTKVYVATDLQPF